MFYRAGIIERWGTGTLNIIDWCAENDNPPPDWSEQAGSVYVSFLPATLPDIPQVGTKLALSRNQVEAQVEAQVDLDILTVCAEHPLSSSEIATALGHKKLSGNLRKALPRLKEARLLEYTIPEKPKSRLQKYRRLKRGTLCCEFNYVVRI